MQKPSIRGRGTSGNVANRFTQAEYVPELEDGADEVSAPETQFLKDCSRSIIAYNDSPDIGYSASLNPYRGCEHGCIYCYARPTHEYLGFSAGLDFETRIMVKEDAPDLLWEELASPRWQPQVVAMSGVTDPYQSIERRLQLTRRCLEVFAAFRNPVGIVTKNRLIARDLDVLSQLAQYQAVSVRLSLTTLDTSLNRVMEPRTSLPRQRLQAISMLHDAGIPTGVLVAPVLPGLTDHEIPALLSAAAEAGAQFAGFIPLRLPHAVAALFENWLEQHFPNKKDKVLNRIRAMRSGQLNDPRFGCRMTGEGLFADQIARMFTVACRKAGISEEGPELSTSSFRRVTKNQLELF